MAGGVSECQRPGQSPRRPRRREDRANHCDPPGPWPGARARGSGTAVPPDDRDLEDADIRDGELDGRPLLDGLHAKNAGQRAVVRRGPEDKVRPATRGSARVRS